MFVQAATGLAFPRLYRDTQPWMLAAWRGNDAVTLLLAVPALVWATQRARRGSTRGLLLALGVLWFCFYNDAYYLFGTGLGLSFPLYVAIMVTCAITLIVSLPRVDPREVAEAIGPRAPARAVAAALVFVGGGLAAVWLAQWAAYVTTGKSPDIGPDAMRLVAAMDLSVIAPSLVAGGVLLWRRRPWGFVVASLGGVLGGTYALVLAAGTVVGIRAGIPGMAEQLPLWIGIAVVMLGALLALLWKVEHPTLAPMPHDARA
jgi:hypothetical protein